MTRQAQHASAACVLLAATLALGCNGAPQTYVSLDNAYPPAKAPPALLYAGWWQAVAFDGPIAPGESSDLQLTVPASDNPAYAVLAPPGWDPTHESAPTKVVVLQSRSGYAVSLGDTLHIRVSDNTFDGDCAAGSHLTQEQADVITQRVFPSVFAGLRYDAATCTTTPVPPDAAAP